MRRLIYILSVFLTLAVLPTSCMMYSDKDEAENPRRDVYDYLYFSCVEPLFRAAELACFFDGFIPVKDDADKVYDLGYGWFGSFFADYGEFSVDRDAFTVEGWGTVSLTDGKPGVYSVVNESHFYGYNMRPVYTVTALGEGVFEITAEGSADGELVSEGQVEMSALVTFSGEQTYKITGFELEYTEEYRSGKTYAKFSSEELTLRMCYEGDCATFPQAGTMDCSIDGEVDDEFTVEFRDSDKVLIFYER